MSNPRAFRATLHTISDAIKSQSSGSTSKINTPTSPLATKFPSRCQTPLSPLSHSRSISTTTHPMTPTATPMDTVPIPSSPAQRHIPRSRSISHNSHIRSPSGSPNGASVNPQAAQLVSIYDKPAWSGEPRQQSIMDLAASESHSMEGHRGGKSGSGTSRHPSMTVHIYDGPSCP